jgi:hypothetical protein
MWLNCSRKLGVSVEMVEEVMIKYGRYEVLASRMQKYVQQEEMSEGERDRIVKNRREYLRWMHEHFADKLLPPPASEET